MNIRLFVAIALLCSQSHAAFLHPQNAANAMVTSANSYATETGVEILKKGGNAIDAGVATAFAISVVEPFSAGIGGGGFLLLHLAANQKTMALDFRETAPRAATKNMYLDAQGKAQPKLSLDGYLSVAVPGTVAGLYEAHRKYGRLPWAKVLAPSIALAERGFIIDWRFVKNFNERQSVLQNNPNAWAIFSKKGKPFAVGDRLNQRDLAKTLRSIAKNPQSFYVGTIAQQIVSDMRTNGGIITLDDLKEYKPQWREPLCGTFMKTQICSMPPPSSGGVILVEMLNMLEHVDFPLKWHEPSSVHVMSEIMKIAYADRATHLGDPAFVQNPIDILTSKTYAKTRLGEVSSSARPSAEIVSLASGRRAFNQHESNDTSHLVVVDQFRNALSLTFTINYNFGSGVVVPGTGILLNDEMDDFASAPGTPNAYGLLGSEANSIAPGKIPLSSMTPVIALLDGKVAFATGTPGGSRIITTVFQNIVNMLVFGMNASEAISAPRFHHQWMPDKLFIEEKGLDPLTIGELIKKGHDIEEKSTWCNANTIVIKADGTLEGAIDPRGVGLAKGF